MNAKSHGRNIISPAILWYSSHATGFAVTFSAYQESEKMRIMFTIMVPAIPIPKYASLRPRGMFIFSMNAPITREKMIMLCTPADGQNTRRAMEP